MQEPSQRTVAVAATTGQKAGKVRMQEAARAGALAAAPGRARYVDPACERLLGQVANNAVTPGRK